MFKDQRLRLTILAMIASVVGSSTAFSADPVNTSQKHNLKRDWEFVASIPGFLPWINGTIRTGGAISNVNITGKQILKALRFGVMVKGEAIYQEKFTGTVDLLYANLGASKYTSRGANVSLSMAMTILEGRFGYRFLSTPQSWLEGYAGLRYWNLGATLALSTPGIILPPINAGGSLSEQWLDPIIGLRARHNFTPNWYILGQADIGGFNLSSNTSKFSWRVQAGIGYQWNKNWSLDLTYKALSVNFDNRKPGAARFVFDDVLHGPVATLSYRF